MANITIYFKPVYELGVPTNVYHEFLVYTDDSGNEYFVRGGPSKAVGISIDLGGTGNGSGGPGLYGWVFTQSGTYGPGSIDYPPAGETYQSQVLMSGTEAQLGTIWSNIISYSTQVNTQEIPYGFGGPDCNSFVYSALTYAGVPVPTDDSLEGSLPAPGSDVPLSVESSSTMEAQELATISASAGRDMQAITAQFQNAVQAIGGDVEEAIDGVIGAFS